MKKLFGTDGIRGTTNDAGENEMSLRLTPELVLRIGQAAGWLVQSRLVDSNTANCVILGRDPRISGMMLESAMTAGLLAQGVGVAQVGVIPTPAVAFLVRRLDARLGIVISASHNPVDDNGIKFFSPQGYKLDDELEDQIETMVLDPNLRFVSYNTRNLGRLMSTEGMQQMYIDHLVQSWRGKKDLSGLFVLLECANGATSYIAPEVFQRLGARVETVNGTPDGLNINESYEYVEPRQLSKLVLEKGADFGVAFDGDGDRVILVDERGGVVDGDTIMAILAQHLSTQDRLSRRVVVTTNMSNYGLHYSLQEIGVEVVETRVGDKFVLEQMLAIGSTLGGERSGHILILDGDQTTGDGIYTALAVAAAVPDQPGVRLSELASKVPKYPQFIESVPVPSTRFPLGQIADVQDILEQLRTRLGAQVDINLRYSGTEDKLRLSVRGRRDDDPGLMVREAKAALQQIVQIVAALEATQCNDRQVHC